MSGKTTTRRAFMGQAVAAGLVVGASGMSAARVIGANDRINLGLIGCGVRGRS